MEHYKREEIDIRLINRIANRVRKYYAENQKKDIEEIQGKYTRRKKKKRN